MKWYIHQGDDLKRARPIEFDFFRDYREDPSKEDLQDEITLEECEIAHAPRHPREALLKKTCTLRSDLSVVPKELFERKWRLDSDGNHVNWWELHYKLVVTIQSGPMLFSINCHGQEYGVVAATY